MTGSVRKVLTNNKDDRFSKKGFTNNKDDRFSKKGFTNNKDYWCSVYGICKWSDTLWPVGRVRLFADYTISLSSLCRLIWKHWTTKMLVRYIMPSVCLRLRQFSQLSLYSLYGAVCLQLTQFSCDDRENVYFILLSSSNRKYESLTMLGHEKMVCAVCLTMFLRMTGSVRKVLTNNKDDRFSKKKRCLQLTRMTGSVRKVLTHNKDGRFRKKSAYK